MRGRGRGGTYPSTCLKLAKIMLETSNVVLKYTHICSFHDLHMTWHYKRFFKCDSKKILIGLICDNCDIFYIGEIEELKQRT